MWFFAYPTPKYFFLHTICCVQGPDEQSRVRGLAPPPAGLPMLRARHPTPGAA